MASQAKEMRNRNYMGISTLTLRTKILAIIMGITLLAIATMVVIVIFFIKPRLESKLEKRGNSIAHAISPQCITPILTRKLFQLEMFFREFITAEGGVDYIYVLDQYGEVTAHTFGRNFPVELKMLRPLLDSKGHGVFRILAADRDIIDISVPLLDGRLGRLHVGMSASSIKTDVNEILVSLISVAVIFCLSSLLILFFLERWIIRPIFKITEASSGVGGGDLDRRVEVVSQDEIGSLAAEFNRMLDSVKESRAILVQEKAMLAESEERLKMIIEQSPISMAVVAMDGTIEYMNNCAVTTFGYQLEDIPHMNDWWLQAYPDEVYRDQVKTLWMDLVAKAIAENQHIERSEYLVTCKDGTVKTMMIFGVLVANKVFVIFEDMTEQKLASEQLRESEHRYQIFTSNTSDYVYKCSRRDGEPYRILWMAGATEAITGYSIDELKQISCWMQIVHPDDKERVSKFLLSLVPGDRNSIDFRIVAKGGGVRWIHESSFCRCGDVQGELYHYGSSKDITEQKLAEAEVYRLNSNLESLVSERTRELIISNRDLTSFCYAISHELRAPVARLKGLSQALLEEWGKNPADAEYCAKRIEVASNDLQLVIDAVLQLSRLSKVEFLPQLLDLSSIVREIATSLLGESPERTVEFVIAGGITAIGDLPLVRLCLENLLGNAFKYTAREASARIEFEVDTVTGAYFVRDNGVGFAMEHADGLFEPFTRLHVEEEFAGTGIGLATVQRIIERHGGRIWSESSPGHGATFFFTLTASKGDKDDSTISAAC